MTPYEYEKNFNDEIYLESVNYLFPGLKIDVENYTNLEIKKVFSNSIKVDRVVPDFEAGKFVKWHGAKIKKIKDGQFHVSNVTREFTELTNETDNKNKFIATFNSRSKISNLALIESYKSNINGEAGGVAIIDHNTVNVNLGKITSENNIKYNFPVNNRESYYKMASIMTTNGDYFTYTHEVLHNGGIKHKKAKGNELNTDGLFFKYVSPFIKLGDATNNNNASNVMSYISEGKHIDLMQAIHFRLQLEDMLALLDFEWVTNAKFFSSYQHISFSIAFHQVQIRHKAASLFIPIQLDFSWIRLRSA